MKVKLHSNCFDDELFHLFLKKPLFVPAARLGPFGNYGANTLVNLEPALLDQVLNGFMRSVRVDFESECQGWNGRKGLPRLELAADKGLLCGENHLVDNGFAWLEVDERCHMDNVTPVTEGVKEESDAGGRCFREPRRPYVELYDFIDRPMEVRWKGVSLPYRVFSKDQRVSHTAIVENKRLGHALALVKAQQDLRHTTRVMTNSEKTGYPKRMRMVSAPLPCSAMH